MARHSAYVCRLLSICQMTVASFLITATRAMVLPRLRRIRLYHSRSRASFRNAWWATCASSHRARPTYGRCPLPALVIRPSR